jgi:hypothetical protein
LPSLQRVETRRSSRINNAIAVTIQGSDAFRASYLERVSTLTVSCHGCRYQSKHDVLEGEVVFLELESPNTHSKHPSRGRVKQVKRLASGDMPFEVVLELEPPGNIWGIPSPPADWFPTREATVAEASGAGRELRAVAHAEQQIAAPAGGPAQISHTEKDNGTVGVSPLLGQLMAGLGEQIRVVASKAVAGVLAKEQGRLLDEFRARLQDEVTKTLEHAMATSKQEIAARAARELNEAHEVAVRATYERWTKKLEEDFKSTSERAMALGNQASEHVERAAASAIERVQGELDASRRDAADKFRARLQSQLTPLLEDARTAVQKLAAFEDEVKVRSLAICGQFNDFIQQEAHKSSTEIQEKISGYEKQLETSINERLAKVCDELDKKSAAAVDAPTQTLLSLSQSCEQTAQSRLASLAESAVNQTTNTLKEKTAELARQFSGEIEGYRSYLEFIGRSISEIAKKPDVRPPG